MVTEDREERLRRLAEAIADGRHVNWEKAVAEDPDSSDSIKALQLLEIVSAAHTPPATPIPTAWGSLAIREKIGEGAFGEVYRAFDPSLEREVALKLLSGERALDESASARFLEEARRLARVRHENVVVVHGADLRDRRVGMWTDLVHGSTLEQILIERGPFGEREAANIGIDLCRALAAVHAAKLVHRDVKTQNVMRDERGRILLMDFGSVGTVSASGTDTADGGPYGTPLATAPEVLESGVATTRSDIYSLGVLLFRVVTGRYPVEAATYDELMEKHRRRERVWLREARPDLSPSFVRAVERALDPDPRARYSGPGEMERALLASIHGRTPLVEQIFGWLPAGLRVPAAVTSILMLLAGTAWVIHDLRPRPAPESITPRMEKGILTAHATLYRDRGPETPAEQLMPGARVAPGDALFLELWGEDSMTVYVLNEDARGRVYVLFPLPGFDLKNPLPARGRHRLPGTREGAPENWRVTSIGDREDIIVIASRSPLEVLDREIASLPAAKPGEAVQAVELSAATGARLRGIGGTEAAAPPAVASGPSRLSEALTSIASEPERARDVWIWQTKLENPPTP